MDDIVARLEAGDVLVSDGAMSTMLNKFGLTAGACPEEWNVTHPDAVSSVYRSYIEAGSDLISTNTLGGNRLKLDRYGLSARSAEINAAGVKLARQEAGDTVIVAASVGPTGHLLEPLGELPVYDAADAYQRQTKELAEAGADAILFETFFDLGELKAAVDAALPLGIPLICTMTFDASGRTVMGVDATSAAAALVDMGVRIVGTNCGMGPESMLPIVQTMVGKGAFIMAQPNAGLPTVESGETVYNISPESMADYALQFVAAGANIVGGCCGSTPEHIAAIAKAVKS